MGGAAWDGSMEWRDGIVGRGGAENLLEGCRSCCWSVICLHSSTQLEYLRTALLDSGVERLVEQQLQRGLREAAAAAGGWVGLRGNAVRDGYKNMLLNVLLIVRFEGWCARGVRNAVEGNWMLGRTMRRGKAGGKREMTGEHLKNDMERKEVTEKEHVGLGYGYYYYGGETGTQDTRYYPTRLAIGTTASPITAVGSFPLYAYDTSAELDSTESSIRQTSEHHPQKYKRHAAPFRHTIVVGRNGQVHAREKSLAWAIDNGHVGDFMDIY
ncbi:hypothetical protein BDZ91DRAFT_763533 [Kalaharituber pfeilii]|nr:hypothetical protein BDZ91DRAFT_763533 [Kalaharituber pfeilii]